MSIAEDGVLFRQRFKPERSTQALFLQPDRTIAKFRSRKIQPLSGREFAEESTSVAMLYWSGFSI